MTLAPRQVRTDRWSHASLPPAPRRYGVALLAVAGALAVCLGLREWIEPSWFVVFLAAVVVAGWYGGEGPALLAAAASVVALNYFFMAPYGGFGLAGTSDASRLLLFLALALLSGAMHGRLHAARREAEERLAESSVLAGQLQEQAAELEAQSDEAQALSGELEQQVQESAALRRELESANERLRVAAADAEASRVRLGRILETLAEGVALFDGDGRVTFANRAAERLLADAGRLLPAGALPVGRVLDSGEAVFGEEVAAEGPERRLVLRVNASPLKVVGEESPGVVVSFDDVTARTEAEEQLRFLVEAGSLLASTLDHEATLRSVARLAVPLLADYCVIDLVEDGGVRRVEATHADPAMEETVRRLLDHPPVAGSSGLVARVLRSGVPVVENEVSPAQWEEAARDAEHLEILRALAPTAWMVVPLAARERILGSMLFCAARPGRRYDDADRVRAEELARRAAVAIDNARLYHEAVEANRAKADFMAVMSHELRTPLNAVIGYTDLFLMGIPVPLPEGAVPQMDRVRAAAQHLREMIDEILSFARLEAGHETASPEPADAAEIARAAAAVVEPLAIERRLAFRVDAPSDGVPLVTDVRKARQVLVNLLGNAIKFTEQGEVRLSVVQEGNEVVFRVADTGIGIAERQMERIFEPFWQVEQTTIRVHGGSGLGLSVARQLARLLGGDVEGESEPGRGSVFTLRLPAGTP